MLGGQRGARGFLRVLLDRKPGVPMGQAQVQAGWIPLLSQGCWGDWIGLLYFQVPVRFSLAGIRTRHDAKGRGLQELPLPSITPGKSFPCPSSS